MSVAGAAPRCFGEFRSPTMPTRSYPWHSSNTEARSCHGFVVSCGTGRGQRRTCGRKEAP